MTQDHRPTRSVAVIPARGGSKRIPRKNIREFHGRPMLAWSVDAARGSGVFSRIIVSTDDEEIAAVARACGAETPFMRPADLANDHAGTGQVMAHATRWLQEQGGTPDVLCCVYATAPFIQPADIRRGLEQLQSGDWSYVIAATTYAAPIFRSFRQDARGGLEMFFPEHFPTRSQDLPVALHDAAQFYWGRAQAWLEGRPGLRRDSAAVVIPRWRVQDIDDEDDWRRAELLAPVLLAPRAGDKP